MQQLILGGARSGKSCLAESLILAHQGQAVYIATAQALDAEMRERIDLHQSQRDDAWILHEETIHLAQVLGEQSPNSAILVDCLTLWLTNCLLADESGQLWQQQRQALLDFVAQTQLDIVFVSNEVGQGIVPMDALSRRFVDEAGRLHQALAPLCQRVVFVTAGLPQILKGPTLS